MEMYVDIYVYSLSLSLSLSLLALKMKPAASLNPPPATVRLTVTHELQDASDNPLFNHADNLCRTHSLSLRAAGETKRPSQTRNAVR